MRYHLLSTSLTTLIMEDTEVQIYLYKTELLFAILGVVGYFWFSFDYHCFRRMYVWNINRNTPYLNAVLSKEKRHVFHLLQEYQDKVKTNLTILDVGPGPAVNLAFLPQNTKLICLDPNPHFTGYIKENMKICGNVVETDFVQGYAENMPFESGIFDAAVCSLVLCTVIDIGRSLKEIKRVLKPRGKLVFLEHVAVRDKCSWAYVLQLATIPLARLIIGCRMIRDVAMSIRHAGFSDVQMEYVHPKCAPFWMNTCISGIATK